MPTSFAAQIRPLFRSKDIDKMKTYGGFDLSQWQDVRENCQGILERLANGSMPCDVEWPRADVDLFRRWIDEGMNP